MKKILLVLSSVLVLVLVACNSGSNNNGSDTDVNDNGSEVAVGVNSICAVVAHDGDLAEAGASFSNLPVNPVGSEDEEELLESLADISIDGLEIAFDENSGIIFLCPTNVNQEPWATVVSDLEAGELTSWVDFVQDVTTRFFGPVFSNYPVVVASPFNADLFWLNVVNGFDIDFSAFDFMDGNYGPGSASMDVISFVEGVYVDLREWRTWFDDASVTEVEISISLITGSEVASLDALFSFFGPSLGVNGTEGTLDLGEFFITFDLSDEENITHAIVTFYPVEIDFPETNNYGPGGPGSDDDDYDY